MRHPFQLLVAIALGASCLAPGASAQPAELEFPAASPPASVRQEVGLTTVEIEYSRPSVRERTIFGGLVPYGAVWRTGANAATRITFDTEVVFGGEPVPAGTYALFTIPGETRWTVILNAVAEQWGSYGYDPEQDVVRVVTRTETLEDPVETLRIGLEHLRDDSAFLTLTWETTRVRVPIEIDVVRMLVPRIEAALSAPGEDKPYLAAAMFYYEHDLDLDKALGWVDAALEQRPDAVWVQYRKGLVLEKRGDVEAAREAAQEALAMAEAVGGELGAEYSRLSRSLLDRL